MGGAHSERFLPCHLVRGLSETPWFLGHLRHGEDAGLFQAGLMFTEPQIQGHP